MALRSLVRPRSRPGPLLSLVLVELLPLLLPVEAQPRPVPLAAVPLAAVQRPAVVLVLRVQPVAGRLAVVLVVERPALLVEVPPALLGLAKRPAARVVPVALVKVPPGRLPVERLAERTRALMGPLALILA